MRVLRTWLAALVGMHLIVAVVHGAAHGAAQVPLSAAGSVFVLIAVFAGPLIGIALMWRIAAAGAWVIAAAMAASFVFGLVNHFAVAGPDHVGSVTAAWQPLFSATAVLLALTEAAASILALEAARARKYV